MYLYVIYGLSCLLSSLAVSKANAHPASEEEKFQHNGSASPKLLRCQDGQQVLLRTVPSQVLSFPLEVHRSAQATLSPSSRVCSDPLSF